MLTWLVHKEDFQRQYALAREAQADAIIEEAREIADDGTNDWMEKHDKDGANVGWQINGEAVQRSKLRIEQRRWEAAKLKPKVYSERIAVEHSGSIDINLKDMTTDDLVEAIKGMVATGHLPAEAGELEGDDPNADLG